MNKAKELVQMIQAALADDADDVLRQRAIKACDQLLLVMDAEPGQPLASPKVPAAGPELSQLVLPTAPAPAAPAFSPATQMLDALIAKLKTELGNKNQPGEPAPSKELRIPFVPLPSRQTADPTSG